MKRLIAITFSPLAGLMLLLQPAYVQAQALPDPPPDHWYRKIVDFDFIRPYAVIPPRDDGIVIDARDKLRRFDQGHLPGAINLPAKQFDELAASRLPADKNTLIIFYCDGIECKLSHMAADDTDDLGYTNIRVYAAGFPDWFRKGQPYVVSAEHLAKLITSEEVAHIYDLRPAPDYRSGHLPAAHYLPAALFESLSPGVLPSDKEAALLFYGDTQAARQSYDAAMKAAALGHRHVMLLEGGYQAWEQLSR